MRYNLIIKLCTFLSYFNNDLEQKNPYLAEIYECQLLSGEKSNREIRHYEIDLGNSKNKYESGDSVRSDTPK